MKQINMKKILIIDDSQDILGSLKDLFEYYNYEVMISSNSEDGLNQIRINPPDLLICDLLMPGTDGYIVLQEFKQNPETKDRPVIVISGLAEKNDKEKVYEIGVEYYITKPFSPKALLELVKKIFN